MLSRLMDAAVAAAEYLSVNARIAKMANAFRCFNGATFYVMFRPSTSTIWHGPIAHFDKQTDIFRFILGLSQLQNSVPKHRLWHTGQGPFFWYTQPKHTHYELVIKRLGKLLANNSNTPNSCRYMGTEIVAIQRLFRSENVLSFGENYSRRDISPVELVGWLAGWLDDGR